MYGARQSSIRLWMQADLRRGDSQVRVIAEQRSPAGRRRTDQSSNATALIDRSHRDSVSNEQHAVLVDRQACARVYILYTLSVSLLDSSVTACTTISISQPPHQTRQRATQRCSSRSPRPTTPRAPSAARLQHWLELATQEDSA